MRAWVLVLALAAFGAQAADDDEPQTPGNDGPTPCDNVETAQQSFDCSAYNRKTAETELGESVKDLTDRINSQFADHPTQLNDLLGKVKAAQRLWEQLRDADCAVDTFNTDKNSQAYQIALNDCIAQKSDERSETLQSVGME
ncbi:lysozyme inhibitor LprI family protein [Pseudomonas sp. HR96]|uniref:lysozyme inhibitor LprI family protein n=1 Tax=Pseudomonas sp. HR96 TaxID=1027966 RepID=UPI002A75D714|nr:lysozyme inhibitor LprI family protein [Pseudomonas sp. HR96]WPP00285.1 lysozyme inhibitor LprI family protein [Pseudomonas sp. HR96]